MSSITTVSQRLAFVAALGLAPAVALADSISPDTYSATLGVGESVTITKTVTVDAGTASTSKVDVYFLADTTGSMGSYINAVKTSATNIMNAVAGLGDVAFAVGNYQDYPISPYGGAGDFPYQLNTAMTTNVATAQAGINSWTLGWGNDIPESQFTALEALSGSQAGAVGWRGGSRKIVVWFGDAVGHDPSDAAATGTGAGYPGPTQAAVISSLNALGASVEAVNSTSAGFGIDGRGQASEIAAATGGHIYNNTPSFAIASVIQAAIEETFTTYSVVGLDLSEAPTGVAVASSPAHVGSWDRSEARTFDFDVTFTGVEAGTHDFSIYGTVDGGRVATETDHIVVTSSVPEAGSSVILLGAALTGLALFRRRKSANA